MIILGIDYGDARMGFAASDMTGFLAGGIGTVKVTGLHSAVEAAAKTAKERGAQKIVVGLPVNMDGTEGDRAARCRRFGEELAEKTGIPVEYHDERRTTILAAGYMNETGTYGKKRKAAIDTLSAQLILQSYLDRNRK